MSDTTLNLAERCFVWSELDTVEQQALLQRPTQKVSAALTQSVTEIVESVRQQGDAAVIRLTQKFDCPDLAELSYPAARIA